MTGIELTENDVQTESGPRLNAGLCLTGVLALGLLLRLGFLVASGQYVDGDEAMVGIQALEILQGHHSVFFAGELLAGSIEAYLVAPVFWLLGASPLTLRLVPLAFSLALIYLTYRLGERAFGQAVGLLGALLVALGPLLLTVVSLKTWGGYIETMVIGAGALLMTMSVLALPRNDARSTRYLAAIGLLSGLATWMHPLYFYYLFAVGLLLARRLLTTPRELAAFALPFLAGCSPLFAGYLSQTAGPEASSVASLVPLHEMGGAVIAALSYLATDALPALWGLRPIKGAMPISAAWFAIPIYLAAIACFVLRAARDRKVAQHVLLVFLALTPPVFVLGAITNGNYTVILPDSGLLNRYVLPAFTVLPITVAALAWELRRASRWLPAVVVGAVVLVNLWNHAAYEPVAGMRSPFENVPLPASNVQLIDFLAAHDIRHAYASHWIGYRLMFETGLRVQTFDYVETTYGPDRLARASRAVEESPEPPAYILAGPRLFDPTWEGASPLEKRLADLQVGFERAHLDHYIVLYNLSRRVSPAEVRDALVWPFWYS